MITINISKRAAVLLLAGCGLLLSAFYVLAAPDAPLGSGFSYQGRVTLDGAPVNGTCDLEFTLWDAQESGAQVGSPDAQTNVPVSDGLFSVVLNAGGEFGANPFAGQARWLRVRVRCPAGSGSYTTLSPRQQLTGAPYAFYAERANRAASADTATNATNATNADQADQADHVNWSGVQSVPQSLVDLSHLGQCAYDQGLIWDGDDWVCHVPQTLYAPGTPLVVYDGGLLSVGDHTYTIYPDDSKSAVVVSLSCQWTTASGSNWCAAMSDGQPAVTARAHAANVYSDNAGIVPVKDDKLVLRISGASAHVYLRIWGAFGGKAYRPPPVLTAPELAPSPDADPGPAALE